MKQYTINDSRINRDNNFGYYTELCRELVKTATGMQRDNLHGHTMTWDKFEAVSYMHDNNDVQVDVVLDFNTNAATITVKGDRHQEPEHTDEKAAEPVADFSLEERRAMVEAFTASDEQTEETEEKETIVYVKYCPNVFVAKCEKEHQKGDIVEIETRSGNVHECEIWNFLGHSRKDGKPLYSITRTDGTNKATIAARRAERRREWAEKAEERSTQYFQRSEDAVAGIVPGQPILVGHHSEKRHRAALERSWNAMDKSVAESKKAEAHNEKAEYWEGKAEDITLDMPESLEYFKEQLAKAEEYHAGVKSGKYPREHAFTLTYAKKRVNEMAEKVRIATKLWGSTEDETTTETATETTGTAAEQPTETTTTTAQETATESGNAFEVGQTYYSRSMCDYDCIFTVKVLARNGSKLTIDNWDGKTIKKMAKKDENGVEFFADGRYSMAPIFRANKKADDIPHDDDPTPEPDPTGTDPTEQKTDSQNAATPTGQKCPAPYIATADTSDPAAMKEAAENVREWCNTDQLEDPTPYAAEFDNVAALAWAVLNNYTPTEAEQMTAAALQLAAKMQRRANEINEATAAMEETNRQECDPEQWEANREEIEEFAGYAEELTMYAEGLAAAVGVPDWQLCDVAAIPGPQDDPAQLAMALTEEKPAPTEAANVTDAEVYEQAARIRATYEALKAEAETPSNQKTDTTPSNQKTGKKIYPNVWAGKIDKTKKMQFAHLYDYKDGAQRHQPIIFYGTKKGLLSWIWQQLSGHIINERLTDDWVSMGRGRNEWRMYDENGKTAFIVNTQECDARPQLEILRAWNPDSLSDYERKIVRENDPNEDAARAHFNDLADNDPEGIHNVYYRIDVPYYVDSICTHNPETNEMAKIAVSEFYEEIIKILTADGWTNKNGTGKLGSCPVLSKGQQELYCHPQDISGNVNASDVERIFNLLLTAKTFTTRGADDYGAARHGEPIKTIYPIGASCAVPVAA